VLEFFAAVLSRDQAAPVLLVTQAETTPYWLAPHEVGRLCCGNSDFTCCQTNHFIRGKKVNCDRPILRGILSQLLDKKIKEYLMMDEYVEARMATAMSSFLLRGLPKDRYINTILSGEEGTTEDEEDDVDKNKKEVEKYDKNPVLNDLKRKLYWNMKRSGSQIFKRIASVFKRSCKDDMIDEESSLSLLMFAVMFDDLDAVRAVLNKIKKIPSERRRHKILNCRTTSKSARGYLTLPSYGLTALHIAMFMSSTDVVHTLLDYGVDTMSLNEHGENSFTLSCQFGRIENMELWLKRFPEHNLHQRNKVTGGFSMSAAVSVIADKIDTFEFLLKHDADLDQKLDMGLSVCYRSLSLSPFTQTTLIICKNT
jgi:hypothetical protein